MTNSTGLSDRHIRTGLPDTHICTGLSDAHKMNIMSLKSKERNYKKFSSNLLRSDLALSLDSTSKD